MLGRRDFRPVSSSYPSFQSHGPALNIDVEANSKQVRRTALLCWDACSVGPWKDRMSQSVLSERGVLETTNRVWFCRRRHSGDNVGGGEGSKQRREGRLSPLHLKCLMGSSEWALKAFSEVLNPFVMGPRLEFYPLRFCLFGQLVILFYGLRLRSLGWFSFLRQGLHSVACAGFEPAVFLCQLPGIIGIHHHTKTSLPHSKVS